jgi:hypothetical protein
MSPTLSELVIVETFHEYERGSTQYHHHKTYSVKGVYVELEQAKVATDKMHFRKPENKNKINDIDIYESRGWYELYEVQKGMFKVDDELVTSVPPGGTLVYDPADLW